MTTSAPTPVETPPTATAPSWTEVDWRPYIKDAQIGGRRLRYLDYHADSADRPALLLIHGLGGCWQWWLEVLPALGRRHRVIAVDLPGFGGSEELPLPATMATHAEVVAELADSLRLTGVTVAGHSMGGLVTLDLARTRSDLIAKVILVNAGGVPMSESRLRAVVGLIQGSRALLASPAVNRAVIRRPRVRAAFSQLAVGNAGALSLQLADQVVPLMAAPGYVEAVIEAARAVRDTNPEAVAQPTLLLWGADDPIVTLANARDMERRLPDPTLVVIPGTGHSPFIGKPDAFIAHVLDFTAAT